MKVLIIEDETELARSINAYLSDEHYICEIAATFNDAIQKIALYEYDCILLDLMLPGGTGMQILELIRAQHKTNGVIIISAKNDFDDKINGLNLGADDYLSKPFYLPELAARIHSVIRRRSFSNHNLIRHSELSVDLLAKTVTVHNLPVPLTRKEFSLLLYLINNKNRVVSKNAIAEHLSGDIVDMFDNYDFIYAHVKNLKRKLHEAGCNPYFKTIYGVGYKWEG